MTGSASVEVAMDDRLGRLTGRLAMLQPLEHLDSKARDLLSSLLLAGALEAHELARETGLTDEETEAAVEALRREGLVEVMPGPGLVLSAARTPGRLHRRLAEDENALSADLAALAGARRLLSEITDLAVRQGQTDPAEGAQRIVGTPKILDRLLTETQSSTEELLAFVNDLPPGAALQEAKTEDAKLLERGVRCRCVYLSRHALVPDLHDYMAWFHDAGAGVRLATVLPVRLIIIDRRIAFVSETDKMVGSAVVLDQPGVVAALVRLFQLTWEAGDPLFCARERDTRLSQMELEILRMFAEGVKDDTVARRLNISIRTVRRVVSALTERWQVGSRFELGMVAASRGLIGQHPPRRGTD